MTDSQKTTTLTRRIISERLTVEQRDSSKAQITWHRSIERWVVYSSCFGPVVQMVSTPACHAGSRGFEPLWFHHHRSFILTNNYCSRAYRTRYVKIDKPVLLWAWNWFRPGLNPKWTSGYLGSNPSKSTIIWGYRSRVGQRTLTALMFVRVKLPLPEWKINFTGVEPCLENNGYDAESYGDRHLNLPPGHLFCSLLLPR